ncbi:glycosyl hydrolase family 28-related protein [Halanaerobacter jeridensis]|uniref:Sugar lactone lactonase YvrE n=1 Tax=Halanaerobacter jeridensis TaxID=706427 RepID=A0A938XPK1_9FIRM|nr:glycosyl hydrolase family 28-related protein [Halanaerobacter jeridensis]MBM7557098.1 sugar lactone lactonase YvrE [Halanaerobacter jeridensis]
MNQQKSFYPNRPNDPKAVYFTPENFPVSGDGTADDTKALQLAIKEAKDKMGYGIVFIPEGRYRISETIYVPKAVRLIGFGEQRPLIFLEKDSPEFQTANPEDKGRANYMFWFTDTLPQPEEEIEDANPGTFYSAMSNINLKIEEGNPTAVALRTHYAQHSFISHVDIDIGDGKAGIFDVGNEIENVRFFGGDYGIYTTKTSPGWPFMMIDTYFEGQKKAAIKTQEAGLTIVRMNVKNTPQVIEINPNFYEKLIMKDCQFENIKKSAIIVSNKDNALTQINLRNLDCQQVPKLISYRQSDKVIKGKGTFYKVKSLTHGNQMDNLDDRPRVKTTKKLETLNSLPAPAKRDIPDLPPMKTWANLKELGAKGDGSTDDTKIIKEAIENHSTIYLPQGRYRVSETIELKPNTNLIGLNPISTQILITDNTESFGGFDKPKPLLKTPQGGENIVSGIAIDTGGRNPRAVGCKWMAGSDSYMNDVKFIGGHGNIKADGSHAPMYNESRTGDINPDRRWDSQYWSLWITDGGGGIFKDIWTASPYASAGIYVSDTSTKGCIYAMSVEHHVRNEVKFKNVSNWEVFALQLEEEAAESWNCQPLEIDNCNNMLFANLYFFRTIWVENPYPYAIKNWDSKNIEFLNIHNYAQVKYTINNTLLDVNTKKEVRPWQLARLYITDKESSKNKSNTKIEKLATGFEFIDGICSDSKGNIYFVDSRWKKIYKWSVESDSLSLVSDIHFKPLSLACDKEDNLLVVVEYFPPEGATINGEPEVYPKPEDAQGTSFGEWYNTGSTTKVYSIDPQHPEESMEVLKVVDMDSVEEVHKALHPANRWRDSNDYLNITVKKPEECYIAPDGVTIIPICYDLIRANSLLEAYPGQKFYGVDEYYKRTILFDVTSKGYLSNPRPFVEKGEYNLAIDDNSNVYIADGDIYVYNEDSELLDEIIIPERPATITFGGQDGETLYITARSSLYRVNNL